jgi:hypothetical protein
MEAAILFEAGDHIPPIVANALLQVYGIPLSPEETPSSVAKGPRIALWAWARIEPKSDAP